MSSCLSDTFFLSLFFMCKWRAHVCLRATQSDEMPNSITAVNKKQEREWHATSSRDFQSCGFQTPAWIRKPKITPGNWKCSARWTRAAQVPGKARCVCLMGRRERRKEEEPKIFLLFIRNRLPRSGDLSWQTKKFGFTVCEPCSRWKIERHFDCKLADKQGQQLGNLVLQQKLSFKHVDVIISGWNQGMLLRSLKF